ncbi:glycosyltransferase family 2 protein [Aeoliella sp. SH292]|uniref:glycosyltransferase family 2 protein n=1 Tax=Aeoliella sp. SH292 TaxID=3454464 RepID=UPI003F9556F3
MPTPRISVLMSVYNGERYLRPAMDSLVAQTFADFELIVVDDGSTDASPQTLDEYAAADARIRVVHQANRGLTRSLNHALSLATGEYIARMDADDICFPERFARQVAYMDLHPEVLCLGTGYEAIDAEGNSLGPRRMSEDPAMLDRSHLAGNTSLAHPTILVRRDAMLQIGGYDEAYKTTQDLDLFLRLAELGTVVNIDEPLLYYRWHDENVSVRKVDQQDLDTTAIVAAAHRRRGLPIPKGMPQARWTFRRVMARKYALAGDRRQAVRFACQAIRIRPLNLRSWYTLFLTLTSCVPQRRDPRKGKN